MASYYNKHSSGRTDPGEDLVVPTPSDTVNQPQGPCLSIRCLTTGILSFITASGNSRSTTLFFQGEILPVSAKRVNVTGSTGTVEFIY